MSALTPPAPAATLAGIIDLLCRAVAARGVGGWLGGLSVILVWTRLRRLGARFVRLAARIEAGRDIPRRRPRPAAPRPQRSGSPQRLPRGRGWLVRLVGAEAAAGASQLQHLLATPEMAALLAASPRTGRLLRPLCRTLGVKPPPALTPPPRPARRTGPAERRPEDKPRSIRPRSVPGRTGAGPSLPAPRRRPPPACGPPAEDATRPCVNSGLIRAFTSRSDNAQSSSVVPIEAPAIP